MRALHLELIRELEAQRYDLKGLLEEEQREVAMLRRENARLRAENRQLRGPLGGLAVIGTQEPPSDAPHPDHGLGNQEGGALVSPAD